VARSSRRADRSSGAVLIAPVSRVRPPPATAARIPFRHRMDFAQPVDVRTRTAPSHAAGARPWRWSVALVLLGGLLLQLSTLSVGFFADDYVHQLVLAEDALPSPIPRWSLYDFGSAADWAGFAGERGSLPWWTA